MTAALTILIVDDDEGHALLIRQNLEEAGLANRIEHLRDGQAALDFFSLPTARGISRAPGPYLVLLDIRMPKVDGIEVLRRIKRDPAFRKMPVIMFSTSIEQRDIEECHQLGCSAYVQKPVDFQQFADSIHDIGRFASRLQVPDIG